jgi:hypothetical protein
MNRFNETACELGYDVSQTADYLSLVSTMQGRGATQLLGAERHKKRKGLPFVDKVFHLSDEPLTFLEMMEKDRAAAIRLLQTKMTLMHNAMDTIGDARRALHVAYGYDEMTRILAKADIHS